MLGSKIVVIDDPVVNRTDVEEGKYKRKLNGYKKG